MIRLPHLETNVTIACQNRCSGCNHLVPLQVHRFKASMLDPAALERDLRNFGRVARVDAWAAIGGEPTLHPGLVDLLCVARASGVAEVLEVWTNGQDLEGMPGEFWSSFDRLVVSVYPGKLTDAELDSIESRALEAGLDLVVKDERHHPNFSRLFDAEGPTGPEATLAKFRACWFRTYSRVLDDGWFYSCCTSPFIAPLLQGKPIGFDGLRVDEHLSEHALVEFLNRAEPFEACKLCAGRNTSASLPLEWSEERDPARWLRASAGIEE